MDKKRRMLSILTRSLGFLLVIYLGYFLKMRKITSQEFGKVLSTIVMNITLPCAILSSLTPLYFSVTLLIPFILGIFGNMLLDFVGYKTHKHSDKLERGVAVVDNSGFNVGTFALPFIQAVFPASYIFNVILFDTGNSIMCIRGNYLIAEKVAYGQEKQSFASIIKKLFSSIPLCTYLFSLTFSLLHLSIPQEILNITSIAGNANPFIAMLMIGTLVDFHVSKDEFFSLFKRLSYRFLTMGALAAVVYFLVPTDLVAKQMVVLCLFAPITTLGPVHSLQLGSKSPEAANLNTLSIFASITLLTILSLLFVA